MLQEWNEKKQNTKNKKKNPVLKTVISLEWATCTTTTSRTTTSTTQEAMMGRANPWGGGCCPDTYIPSYHQLRPAPTSSTDFGRRHFWNCVGQRDRDKTLFASGNIYLEEDSGLLISNIWSNLIIGTLYTCVCVCVSGSCETYMQYVHIHIYLWGEHQIIYICMKLSDINNISNNKKKWLSTEVNTTRESDSPGTMANESIRNISLVTHPQSRYNCCTNIGFTYRNDLDSNPQILSWAVLYKPPEALDSLLILRTSCLASSMTRLEVPESVSFFTAVSTISRKCWAHSRYSINMCCLNK